MNKNLLQKYPVTILFILLGISFSIYYREAQISAKKFRREFGSEVGKVTVTIKNKIFNYETVLRAGISLFKASDNVNRKEWRDFSKSLELVKNWPGIQGLGYSVAVSAKDKQKHIDSIRSEGFKAYTIRPKGERKEYSSIIFLEPFDWRNKRAFGYDMWSNEVRKEAMKLARDSGEPKFSGKITLVQETDKNKQNGFLLYLPLYKNGVKELGSVEQRRRNFLGWVYSPFRVNNLFENLEFVKNYQSILKFMMERTYLIKT
ncbi:CHASE domain-containing protein, partial [bacterium]|nr:CHASE domain-containing protein [bacterium]